MDPIDYLRALRRWWMVIAMLTLIGLLAAFITTPKDDGPNYQATHILVQDSTNSDAVSLARAAFLTTSGDVPNRVAKELNEDPRVVLQGVSAEPDETLNGLRITAVESSPARATKVADAFATALVASLDERTQAAQQIEVNEQQATIANLQAQLATPGLTPAQEEALQSQLDQAQSALAEIEGQSATTAGLTTLQAAQASTTSSSTSARTRVLIGAVMGFLIGVVVALVLTRFDTRIRTKEAAEQAFGVQVLGEVPPLKRADRSNKTIIAVTDPESLSAEVYRGVRTALVVASRARAATSSEPVRKSRQRQPVQSAPAEKLVVVVASPGMGEGKTTTSANLAVAFAESGRSVLLLGCDLRRPELHNYFGVSEVPGLTEELAKPAGLRKLENVVQDTAIPGVRIVPSGEPVEHPGELLTRGIDLIGSASRMADVVVIDTAPLLATDDASVLMSLADAVVLVCRSGRTSIEAATRARELLSRLQAPLVGSVLIGAQQLASARSYYRVDYRSRGRIRPPSPEEIQESSLEEIQESAPEEIEQTPDGLPAEAPSTNGATTLADDSHDRESAHDPLS
jgi:capsular exopolysaccharide synthesis family protein